MLGLDSGANGLPDQTLCHGGAAGKVRAITRQSVQLSSQLTFGNLSLEQTTFELSTPAGSFRLANKEYQMMELFLRNPRQIIPAERFWSESGAMTARWRYRWCGSTSPIYGKSSPLCRRMWRSGPAATSDTRWRCGHDPEAAG